MAPQPIEQRLKQDPLVGEAVLIGDRRKFISALIVPDRAETAARVAASDDADPATLAERPDVRGLFEELVQQVNAELPRYEQIRKFALLPREFSVASGELTPTLKVRRRVVADTWRDVIEDLYRA